MTAFAPANGNCVGQDVNIWFPVVIFGVNREKRNKLRQSTEKALSFCKSCEVKKECLDYSLEHEPWGIWGGLNELQRAELRKIRGVRLVRDGKIYVPGIGSRSANGSSLPKVSQLPDEFISE